MAQNTLDHATPTPLQSVDYSVVIRLCIMMFLEFFIWGTWFVTVGNYMEVNKMGAISYWAYIVGPIAAIISPLFLGIIADRFFASEIVLCGLCLVGAVAIVLAPAAGHINQWAFIAVLFVHTLCFMPTLGVTNSLAFHNLTNQEKQFPIIRVFGTFGWIAANWVVSLLHADKSALQFYLTGASALVMAIFSLALPHTPPPAKGKKASIGELLGLDALQLLRNPSFLVFIIASFLTCIPLAAYFNYGGRFVGAAGVEKIAAMFSVGQMAEVVFMFLMPLFFAFLGVKWMLAGGMLAWVLRYGLFAGASTHSVYWMIVLGIALHGFCYDFFFVTGFIYTDKRVSKEMRGAAQGLLVLVTQGLGMGLGAKIAGELFGRMVGETVTGAAALPLYQKFWAVPAVFAAVVLVMFLALFRDDSKEPVAEARGFEVIAKEPAERK